MEGLQGFRCMKNSERGFFNRPSQEFSFKSIFSGKIGFLFQIHFSPHLLSTETLMSVRESSAQRAKCAVCSLIFNTTTFSIQWNPNFCKRLSKTAEEQVKDELPAGARPHSKCEFSSDAMLNPAHSHLLRGRGKKTPNPPNSQRVCTATP